MYFEKKIGKQPPVQATREHLGTHFSDKKIEALMFFLLFVCLLIFGRLFYLQIIRGNAYRLAAENNRQRFIAIQAERGLIYDRNGAVLSKNIPSFSLAIVPQTLPKNSGERASLIAKLALLVNKSEVEIKELLAEYDVYNYESIVIQEKINYETALAVLIALGDLPGIQIQQGSKRLYFTSTVETTASTPSSLSHILGYMGKLDKDELKKKYSQGYLPSDYIGKTGVEKSYEPFLRGTYGRKRIEVDASGKTQTTLAEQSPVPGAHLRLTIDAVLQQKLEEIITHYLKQNNKSKAAAVVLQPQTGEILALISLPAFDNNDFSGGIKKEIYEKYSQDADQPLFNRVLSGTYPSGSVIKPAIAAAALTEGIINANTSFLSTGGLQVMSWFFPDWQAGGHGITNVRKALAWSVNTFFYYIGGGYNDFTGLGVDKITSYLKKFGFSRPLGIDLPCEANGFLPSKDWKEKTKKEKWYVGDTYNLSIGQGDLLVTPLQIANMTAVFANQGKLLKPRIVKTVINPVTKEKQDTEIEVLRDNFVSAYSVQTVRLGMKDCVDYGSCRRLAALPFAVAGKTGTAQWNSNKPNHAWFTSFAPFNNSEIVVTILVEEGGEGSAIAAPIAYDFYKWWWGYRN